MSNGRTVPTHWRNVVRDSDLDRTATLVALVLSTYMDANGVADGVAKTTLARGAKLGRPDQKGNTAADLAIDRLEAAGLLSSTGAGAARLPVRRSNPSPGRGINLVLNPSRRRGITDSKSLAGADAKSLADLREIPRPGVGESEESEEQSVIALAPLAGKESGRAGTRPKTDHSRA